MSIETKFKEKNPQETIDIIKNFFASNGYTVKIEKENFSEAQTWSCGIALYKDQQLQLSSCGKGATQLYSQASGLAELYERFCNTCEVIRSPLFTEKLTSLSKKSHGYYFHPQEKLMSYEEIISYPCIAKYYKNFLHSDQYIKYFFDIITDNQIIGEPYQDLLNPTNTVYYDRRILNRVTASVGMCAGNSVEEALNQGLSELCEHIASHKFFTEPQDDYYMINLNNISNQDLLEKINAIFNAGFQFHIFDLSYNFQVPALMSVLTHPKTKLTRINFGSFPVFEIAAERIITELYQGFDTFNTPTHLQIPYRSTDIDILHDYGASFTGLPTLNEDIFLKAKIVNPNEQFYINNMSNNKQINEYFINLFKKLNLSVHYIDHSLCPDIAALHIVIPEWNYLAPDLFKFNDATIAQIEHSLIIALKTYKLSHEILYNSLPLEDHVKRLKSIITDYYDSNFDGSLIGNLLYCDWLNPLPTRRNGSVIYNLCYGLTLPNLSDSYNTIFYNNLNTLALLQKYISEEKYTNKEIKFIFEVIFNTSITDLDIQSCNEIDYILLRGYIEPLLNFYFSKNYDQIVETYMKKI